MATAPTEQTKVRKIQIDTPGGKYNYADGKRKTAIATVRLYKGKGTITVNNKALNEYFSVKTTHGIVKAPLKLTGTGDQFDITAKVIGGGQNAQAEALRHAIAKALIDIDEANKTVLRAAGMLTRDPRSKERKKYGLKRARRAPQFSKR